MSVRENIIYYIKKNIFIVLVLIGLCPVLALSYAKFTINSESYRSNEMYISELLYSIKIDNENTYTIVIDPGETEHTVEITSLNAVSTNYKLAYLNNDNLGVKYATDYFEPSFGGIVTTRKISLTIKNTSTEKQTLSLMVFGGYSFNDVEEVKVLDTYTEIDTNYLHYDYETTALYVDNTRVDKLDSTKKYSLVSYTCSDDVKISYDTKTNNLTINTYNQTKCSLYFEEYALKYMCKDKTLSACLKDYYELAGLTKIEQAATGNQNYSTTEYRYQGKEPNNYITFNNETGVWRIIGTFEVQTLNGSGYTKEYKVKIARESIGALQWNVAEKNNWPISTLMTLLNNGDYYNRTGEYESNGLNETAKSQIDNTKWYLGNITWNNGYGNTKELYTQERSTNVHNGNSQTWDGKVALIYPSDYMYASSSCYNDDNKRGADSNGALPYNTDYRNEICSSTDWLLDENWYWTITPTTYITHSSIYVDGGGAIGHTIVTRSSDALHPTLYLSSNIKYLSGSGTLSDPFIIK